MKKLKNWLINRFLPMWAKESVFRENRDLRLEVDELRAELEKKNAYITGLQAGIKSQRRIVINTTEVQK